MSYGHGLSQPDAFFVSRSVKAAAGEINASEQVTNIGFAGILERKLEDLKTAMNELVELAKGRTPVDRVEHIPTRTVPTLRSFKCP